MSSTVLVTGGCGYIGSHVARQLAEAGYRAIVIDDLSNGAPAALINGETLVQSDFSDRTALDKIFRENKIEAILHFAGSIIVPESVANPGLYYENNFQKTLALLRAAAAAGVKKLIFSSTAAVYGAPDELRPITEDARLDPASPYGRSKLMVEWLLEDFHRAHGLDYICLRYFNVAGADPQGRIGQSSKQATHLIKLACKTALGEQKELEVYGNDYDTPDGTCIRDYIHVEDLASAHVLALKHLLSRTSLAETYNCGYGKGYSVLEVTSALEKVLGKKLPQRFADRRAGDLPFLAADSTKLRNELGWKPQFNDLEKIVGSALSWEKKVRGK